MAINSSDCLMMIEEAEKAGKHLFVVKQNRFNPPVVAVKKLLDEKKLGSIYSMQLNCFWNRDAKYYEEFMERNHATGWRHFIYPIQSFY